MAAATVFTGLTSTRTSARRESCGAHPRQHVPNPAAGDRIKVTGDILEYVEFFTEDEALAFNCYPRPNRWQKKWADAK